MTAAPSHEPSRPNQGSFIPENYGQAVWLQYLNCLNAQNVMETESFATGGISSFRSHPSFARFERQVHVLSQMILPTWQDDDYRKETSPVVRQEWMDKYGDPCLHEDGEYFHRECKAHDVTVEPDPIELFGSITRLLNRKSLFPAGDRSSLLP